VMESGKLSLSKFGIECLTAPGYTKGFRLKVEFVSPESPVYGSCIYTKPIIVGAKAPFPMDSRDSLQKILGPRPPICVDLIDWEATPVKIEINFKRKIIDLAAEAHKRRKISNDAEDTYYDIVGDSSDSNDTPVSAFDNSPSSSPAFDSCSPESPSYSPPLFSGQDSTDSCDIETTADSSPLSGCEILTFPQLPGITSPFLRIDTPESSEDSSPATSSECDASPLSEVPLMEFPSDSSKPDELDPVFKIFRPVPLDPSAMDEPILELPDTILASFDTSWN